MGTHFMREAYPALQQLRDDYHNGQHNYIHSMYNIYGFYPDFTQKNEMAMIRNAVIEGFNQHLKFPNAIIVLCNEDFITEDELFLPSEMEKKIRWVLRDITAAINIRKSLMEPKCFTFGQPRIIWVRAFQTHKLEKVSDQNMMKFNNMLRRIGRSKAFYTPDLTLYVDSGARCFDFKRQKIYEGFRTLWLSLSDELKKIDEDDEQYAINLKVEERLKELKRDNEKTFERQAHTYLTIKQTAGQRSDTVRNFDDEVHKKWDPDQRQPRSYSSHSHEENRYNRQDRDNKFTRSRRDDSRQYRHHYDDRRDHKRRHDRSGRH